MKKIKLFLLVSCFLYASIAASQSLQDSLITWKDKVEYAKNRVPDEEEKGDSKYLTLIDYTYKGVIESESVKSAIIDSMLSPDAPFPIELPPIIVTDTTYSEDRRTITKTKYPLFDIITVGKAIEAPYLIDRDKLRQTFNYAVRVGWEFLETEWSYKGVKYKSIAIVSDEGIGVFFDQIFFGITGGITTTSKPITAEYSPFEP
ncbi:hypothetical protein [Prevotella sp. 10(H)]|uniref:hypothetical protein n=1 Tax=Prevotella sp. 10(H) TaxID=1158294 RepID=UPI0012DE0A35|nr:hypothetical protein [Prevotella sp. 10(H)]